VHQQNSIGNVRSSFLRFFSKGGEKRKMGSYFKITVNLPVWATMGQFSLIMPRFFVCFSLKDIILWLGFYGVKKTF